MQASAAAPVSDAVLQESVLREAGGGAPTPLKAIAVVVPVTELLVMVSWPVTVPKAVGANFIWMFALWPELSEIGNVVGSRLKAAPLTDAALMVSVDAPAFVMVTD